MALSHNPKIVTNGLILCLDAINPKCYPGSGTVVSDLSRRKVSCSLQNGVSFHSDHFSLDGTDDWIDCGNSSFFSPTNITASMMVFMNSFSTRPHLFGRGNGTSGNFYIVIETNGTLNLYNDIGSNWYVAVSHNSFPLNKWVHLTCTYNGSFAKIYYDGIEVASQARSGNLRNWQSNVLQIGTILNSQYMNGRIGSVYLYDRGLTASEILQNFNAINARYNYIGPKIDTNGLVAFYDAVNKNSYPGSGFTWYDISGNGHHISLGSSVSFVSAESKGVLNFPEDANGYGRNSSLNLSASNNTVITFSRKNSVSNDGRVVTAQFNNWLLGHHDTSYGDYFAEGWIVNPSTQSDTVWRMFTGTGNIGADIWQLYINDQLTNSSSAGSQGPNGWNLNSQYDQYSNAQIALLIAYNRVLSATEITKIYNSFRGRFD